MRQFREAAQALMYLSASALLLTLLYYLTRMFKDL